MTKTIIAIAVTAAAYLIAGDTDGAHWCAGGSARQPFIDALTQES